MRNRPSETASAMLLRSGVVATTSGSARAGANSRAKTATTASTDAQPQRLIRRGAYRQRFFGTRQCTSLSPPLWGAMRQSMAMLRSA